MRCPVAVILEEESRIIAPCVTSSTDMSWHSGNGCRNKCSGRRQNIERNKHPVALLRINSYGFESDELGFSGTHWTFIAQKDLALANMLHLYQAICSCRPLYPYYPRYDDILQGGTDRFSTHAHCGE